MNPKWSEGHVADEHEVAVLVLVGDGEVGGAAAAAAAGRVARARPGEAEEHGFQRLPQLAVAPARAEVHLPEVGRAVHAHLHEHPAARRTRSTLIRRRWLALGARLLLLEAALPVRPHRRPPHHLSLGGRRRGVDPAADAVALLAPGRGRRRRRHLLGLPGLSSVALRLSTSSSAASKP
uniref:Uncharacterized protein n=1 Tax=Zea mays TaxID=4577 RepID=C4IYI7_MAIZE|nr:unknown [Zea mays]